MPRDKIQEQKRSKDNRKKKKQKFDEIQSQLSILLGKYKELEYEVKEHRRRTTGTTADGIHVIDNDRLRELAKLSSALCQLVVQTFEGKNNRKYGKLSGSRFTFAIPKSTDVNEVKTINEFVPIFHEIKKIVIDELKEQGKLHADHPIAVSKAFVLGNHNDDETRQFTHIDVERNEFQVAMNVSETSVRSTLFANRPHLPTLTSDSPHQVLRHLAQELRIPYGLLQEFTTPMVGYLHEFGQCLQSHSFLTPAMKTLQQPGQVLTMEGGIAHAGPASDNSKQWRLMLFFILGPVKTSAYDGETQHTRFTLLVHLYKMATDESLTENLIRCLKVAAEETVRSYVQMNMDLKLEHEPWNQYRLSEPKLYKYYIKLASQYEQEIIQSRKKVIKEKI